MERIDFPTALPGACLLCGAGDRSAYIDTGFSWDDYGAVIICDICVSMMAQVLGLPNIPEFTNLKERNEGLEQRVFGLITEVEGLHKIVEGYDLVRFARGSGGRPGDNPVDTVDDAAGEPPQGGSPPADAPGGASGSGDGAGDAPEPSDDAQLERVPGGDGGTDDSWFALGT